MKRAAMTTQTEEKGTPPGRRRQKGTILALTSVLITVMLGMLALSIDLGYAFSARNQLQNGVDAATLAGATALRSSIELNTAMPQQETLVKDLAVLFASYNQVRRYADPQGGGGGGGGNSNQLVIDRGQVTVDTSVDLPRVQIDTNLSMPLLFAGLFGLPTATMQSISRASIFPVDGGTGGAGACWRPLLLPDSFFDSSDIVHIVGDPARGASPLPDQTGDYYRSRFAAGNRNTYPYVDGLSGLGSWVTGLRDTSQQIDIGSRTIMGQYVELRRDYYRIADLSSLPRVTFDSLAVGDLANFGYCGQIRVGDNLTVYAVSDATAYDQVRLGLESLKYRTNDLIDLNALTQFRYIKSASYPAPNSHAAIIPVLFYNPIELVRNPGATQLRVTNLGLFYLQEVRVDGTLYGFFVREILAGGAPIAGVNFDADNQNLFKRSWLPMATQLLQ